MTEIVKKRVKVEREVTRRIHRYKWEDIVQLIKDDVQKNCPDTLYKPKHSQIEVVYNATSRPSDHPTHTSLITGSYDIDDPVIPEAKSAKQEELDHKENVSFGV